MALLDRIGCKPSLAKIEITPGADCSDVITEYISFSIFIRI